MKNCIYCSSSIGDRDKFCEYCGKKQAPEEIKNESFNKSLRVTNYSYDELKEPRKPRIIEEDKDHSIIGVPFGVAGINLSLVGLLFLGIVRLVFYFIGKNQDIELGKRIVCFSMGSFCILLATIAIVLTGIGIPKSRNFIAGRILSCIGLFMAILLFALCIINFIF